MPHRRGSTVTRFASASACGPTRSQTFRLRVPAQIAGDLSHSGVLCVANLKCKSGTRESFVETCVYHGGGKLALLLSRQSRQTRVRSHKPPRDCAAQLVEHLLVEHLGRRANMIQGAHPTSFFDFSTDGALFRQVGTPALSCLEEATLITSRRLQATSRLS